MVRYCIWRRRELSTVSHQCRSAHLSISPAGTLILPISSVPCQVTPQCRFKAFTRSCWYVIHLRWQSVLFVFDPGTYLYASSSITKATSLPGYLLTPAVRAISPDLYRSSSVDHGPIIVTSDCEFANSRRKTRGPNRRRTSTHNISRSGHVLLLVQHGSKEKGGGRNRIRIRIRIESPHLLLLRSGLLHHHESYLNRTHTSFHSQKQHRHGEVHTVVSSET